MFKKKSLVKKNLSKPNSVKSIYNMYATTAKHGDENCCNSDKYGTSCLGTSFGKTDCCNSSSI